MTEKRFEKTNFRPVPMKLFAAWEVDRTPPNCIPRYEKLSLLPADNDPRPGGNYHFRPPQIVLSRRKSRWPRRQRARYQWATTILTSIDGISSFYHEQFWDSKIFINDTQIPYQVPPQMSPGRFVAHRQDYHTFPHLFYTSTKVINEITQCATPRSSPSSQNILFSTLPKWLQEKSLFNFPPHNLYHSQTHSSCCDLCTHSHFGIRLHG